jgi:hypothetical protein
MNPIFNIGRGGLLRWSLATFIAASSATAQAQFSGPPVVPILPQQPVAEIVYGRNFASAAALTQLSGDFYDARTTAQFVRPDGRVTTYNTFSKRLNSTDFTVDSQGRYTSIDFADSLTFTAPRNADVEATGGSITLSNLRWDMNSDGTSSIWATTSGTGIGSGVMKAWTTSVVTRPGGSVVLANLQVTTELFDAMTMAMGFNSEGLGYSALQSAASNMGSLTISAVPEAATWAQLGLGLVGLGVLVARKAKPRGAPAPSQA